MNTVVDKNLKLQLQVSKLVRNIKKVLPDDDGAMDVFYTHINQNIRPLTSPSDCPPITVLVYTASKILQPTLAYSEIPSLLDILAQIDHIRQKVVATAQDILNRAQSGELQLGGGDEAKAKAERKTLKSYASAKHAADYRKAYRTNICELCQMHICRTWILRTDSYIIPLLMKEYFPSLSAKDDDDAVNSDHYWRHLRHKDLSPVERAELHRLGKGSWAFLVKARKWEQERTEYFSSIGEPDRVYEESESLSYQNDFQARFSIDLKDDNLVTSLLRYINLVQAKVEVLERMFPKDEE